MQLTDAKKYKNQVRKLYKEAFPKNERAPLPFLYYKTKHKANSFYAVCDNGEFLGLVYTIKDMQMMYVFFLAVTKEIRGQGYGSEILASLQEMHPNCTITLAIEDTADNTADNYTERLKRLEFYKRNGFKQLHIKINEMGVIYELLGTKEEVTKSAFLTLMKNFLGSFLFKIIYRKTELE